MIASMTGFGLHVLEFPGFSIRTEIKSLNGKGFDLNLRMTARLLPLEMEVRSALQSRIGRGTVNGYVGFQAKDPAFAQRRMNTQLAQAYLADAIKLAEQSGVANDGALQGIIGLDDVWQQSQDELTVELKTAVHECVGLALDKFDAFRAHEGKALDAFFRSSIQRLIDLKSGIPVLAGARMEKQREKLTQQLQAWQQEAGYDTNRLEQELIYYFEKWDVTEELTRLDQHLTYFISTIDEKTPGRKLGFIAQEMGREINTIGSKANQADLQRVVVEMKDELEKIKEQLLNVL